MLTTAVSTPKGPLSARRRDSVWPLALLCAAALAAVGAGPARAVDLLRDGPDGLSGWELVSPDKTAQLGSVARLTADGVLALAGKPNGYLVTRRSFDDYRLHAEYRWPADAPAAANGGVLLHVASGPIDRDTWPLSIQVQTKRTRAGDLLPMAGAGFAEPLTSAPGKTPQLERRATDSEKPVGEWNAIDVVCRGGTIEVRINGVVQNRVSGARPAAGRIGLQLEGVPYEVRRITLTALR